MLTIKNDRIIKSIYDLLVDVLIMVCPDFNIISDSEIEDYLSELEGDYYTFFDTISLLPLQEGGMLTKDQMNNIVELKNLISRIPVALWNKDDFRKDAYWEEARKRSNNILNSLGISKRQI